MSSSTSPAPPSEASASLLEKVGRIRTGWALASASAVFMALSIWTMADESPTFDEGSHLVAGYAAWIRGDFRLNPEHPPLAKLLAAVPWLFQDVRWPADDAGWERGDAEEFSYRLLYQSGNDPARLFFSARAVMLIWGLILLWAVHAAARAEFGPAGGYLSLLLVALSPAFLAHTHLVTTDVPLAALSLSAVMAFRRYLRTPGWGWAVAAAGLLGAALLVKYSALLLVPALAWIAGLEGVLRRLRKTGAATPEGSGPRPRFRILHAIAFLAIAWLLIWCVYGFRFAASPDPSFRFRDGVDLTRDSAINRAARFAGEQRLLPESYLHGLAFVQEHAQKRSAFALGRYSEIGWFWYFPFAFLVKTPVSALLLLLGGIWVVGCRIARGRLDLAALLIPAFVFGMAALTSRLNIGERHLFPAYPFLMVAAGALAAGSLSISGGRAVAALACLAALEGIAACPYPLTHFNLPSRVLFQRHEMLVDSNLDWGQDLARLKQFMDRRGIAEIKLAYFGTASPAALRLNHRVLPAFNWYTRYEPGWRTAGDIQPGDWVAISATAYSGVYAGDRSAYLDRFRALKPLAVVGNSILVFRIPPEE